MKKLILCFILFLGGGSLLNANAQQQIPMQIIDESAGGDGPTYAPPRPWYIYEDNYVLTLPAFEDDYTLELRDENGVVVYSVFVPAGTTMVVLPSTLSGSFEIRLVGDSYYYRGYIDL